MYKYNIIITFFLSFSFAQTTSGIGSFLQRGFSPKWSSLDGSSVIFVDGSSSLFLNPAGLVNGSRIGFNGSYVKEKVFDDVQFQQLGMHFSNFRSIGIGFCFSQSRVGGIDQYDENANFIDSGDFSEWVGLVGLAYSLMNFDIGISNLYYQVDNLGMVRKSDTDLDKGRMILGIRYEITNNLSVGVVIKNDAELLPGEYMDGEKKIGIGYNHQVNDTGRDLFNVGISYNMVESSGLFSIGTELIPIENLSIRGSYSNFQLSSADKFESILHTPKASFGFGYEYPINNMALIEISYSTKLNTYPSIMESLSNPMSKSDMLGIAIKIR